MDEDQPNWNEWDIKTKYNVAFADMIEQRTTMMKFLIDNFGIEAMEKFFLKDNPEWAEKLKIGTLKKLFVKMLSKLLPKQILAKVCDIIIENAQYLVGLDHISVVKTADNYRTVQVTNCPVLKQFKKNLKRLKFDNLEERYICTFACVPVLGQMCQAGSCVLSAEYFEKGCYLTVSLKPKEPDVLEPQTEPGTTLPLKNGPP
ncbi:MAG: hypothetical protein ACTSYB_08025 [Candidatus Helarchaeota archaeon]